MQLFKMVIDKNKFVSMPKEEQLVFIGLAHFHNELSILVKSLMWIYNTNSLDETFMNGQTSLEYFHIRLISGKLFEGWQLMEKYYFKADKGRLSKDYNYNGSQEGKTALKVLKKYFNRKIIGALRNNYSFHYNPDKQIKVLSEAEDELSIFVGQKHSVNTLYYFADVLSIQSFLLEFGDDQYVNIETLHSELKNGADNFLIFNELYLLFLIEKYGFMCSNIGQAEIIKLDDLVEFRDVRIPFFTETNNGIV